MTNFEFSNEFDVLYNNITSNIAPGLNEYEKSVFLTKAQDELIKNHYEPLGNKYQKGFDDSSKRQIEFSELIRVHKESTAATASGASLDKRAKMYKLPSDVFIILNEIIETSKGTKQIIPITFFDYTRLMSKPYKEPINYQSWRFLSDSGDSTYSEIITHSGSTINNYIIRYIKRPRPIILTDLSEIGEGLTIGGLDKISECELNPILHQEILQRAVELAKVAYIGELNSTVELGQRSE